MRIFNLYLYSIAIGLVVVGFSATEIVAQLYAPGDPVIAIDTDGDSEFPPGETPENFTDQDSSTKYLNFGGTDTGLIITPQFGASVVQSLQLTTANDAEERDPTSFTLYGTNDPITSIENGLGDQENWIMIASGPISLPSDRFAPSEIVDFPNIISYTSYKLIFPTIKDGGLAAMQVADGQLFTGLGGSGVGVLAESDFAIAVNNDPMDFSSFPDAERPENVIDGTFDKYLNFGYFNSGFIVSRADDARVIINGFTITTANDFFERDPSSYEIYGTNDPVTSGQNSTGQEENWTLVAFGDLDLPEDRFTESEFVAVDNMVGYSAYRVIFPTIRLPANSMQIGEMTFTGKLDKSGCDFEVGDVNQDGVVSLLDVDPFVTLLTDAGFQCEADINGDGAVTLLDVNPFVELLTGG